MTCKTISKRHLTPVALCESSMARGAPVAMALARLANGTRTTDSRRGRGQRTAAHYECEGIAAKNLGRNGESNMSTVVFDRVAAMANLAQSKKSLRARPRKELRRHSGDAADRSIWSSAHAA